MSDKRHVSDTTRAIGTGEESTIGQSLSPMPERVGNYLIRGKIGEGGMGEVYEALQERPVRRVVALKLVKAGLLREDVIARFTSERQTLALMNHPSIAQVFDAGSTPEGRPYFVMEYVEGFRITTYCDSHRFGLEERLRLFLQICRGVEHAHQKGIIHRDIKPSNVLVTELDGVPVPKIIDFGVAKVVSPDLADHPEIAGAVGTPAYMSPEQVVGSEDVDTRADVYSLGVLLYELLCGLQPIDPSTKKTFREMTRAILEDPIPSPSRRLEMSESRAKPIATLRKLSPERLVKRLRGDLDCIALKALAKDRTERYGSAADLVADVGRYFSSDPVASHPVGRRYRLVKFIRKHRVLVTALVAVVATFVGMGSVAFWQGSIAQRRALEVHEQAMQVRASSILASAAAMEDPLLEALLLRELADLPEPAGRLRVAREVLNQEVPVAVFTGHGGQVVDAAFSPDGRWLVTVGDTDPEPQLWRADGTGRPIVLSGHEDRVRTAGFSPDGTRILTASEDGTARVWNADGSGLPIVLRGHTDNVWMASFSPDGKQVVTASSDGTARVWSATGGEARRILSHDQPVTRVAYSADGARIATGVRDGSVRVWPAEGREEPIVLDGHDDDVRSVAFGPDGTTLLTSSWDGTARIWSVEEGGGSVVLRHGSPLTGAAFSPDGKRVVTAARDGTARVWQMEDPTEPVGFLGHDAAIIDVDFSPDGTRILTGSWDGTARIWPADGGGDPVVMRGAEGQVLRARFDPQGALVVTGHGDGTARVWSILGTGEPLVHRDHTDDVLGASLSADGDWVVSASRDGTARVRRADGRGEAVVLRGHEDQVSTASFGPQGDRVLTASSDGTARVWRWREEGEPLVIRVDQPVTAASFSHDGSRIVLAGWDGTVRVWAADGSGEPVVLQGHERPVRSAGFSPDDTRIVTSSWDGTARVWPSDGNGEPVILQGHDYVWSAALSPDGSQVVVASGDGDVRMWNADGRGEPVVLEGHPQGVMSVAFSPEGDRIVTASEDGTVRIWSVAERRELLVLRGHQGRVWSAVFGPGGNRIVTASEDDTVRIWRVTWQGMLGHLEGNVRACLTPEQRVRFLGEAEADAADRCAECEAQLGR